MDTNKPTEFLIRIGVPVNRQQQIKTNHMNINNALMKAAEGKPLKEICNMPVSTIQGVSEGDAEKLQAAFNIRTVQDLGTSKFFLWAQSIVCLAATEE